MDTINSRDTLVNLIENGLTEETIKDLNNILSQSDFKNLNKEEQLNLYNIISLVELKIINVPSLLVKLTIAKANLVSACLELIEGAEEPCKGSCKKCGGECAKDTKKDPQEVSRESQSSDLSEFEDDTYLMKNEAGEIRRYYTLETSGITPPAENEVGTVRINNYNRFGKKFLATVQIDHTGKVVHIVDEPELEDATPLDFDTLYTDLAHEVLKFSE